MPRLKKSQEQIELLEGSAPKVAKKMTKAPEATTTTQLGSLIKSARKIMRKDKGLSGDLDRLPMLTWILFLKFLDDIELLREDGAKLAGKKFRPAIEPPYRWRDWATTELDEHSRSSGSAGGITGDELIAFINNDTVQRPDGTTGPGLFTYLRSLRSAEDEQNDRRDVIATVFRGVDNRMRNGYLLREVIDKVDGIHFNSSDEIHTLSHLYESMLKEMRDAAGDSGEFYTPRTVVRFIVEVTDPKLGESVLDPACGTGGFLVEAYTHLAEQCKTVQDRKVLQTESIFGGEAKPLPYLLVQMNLLLHGLEAPQISADNSLAVRLTDIGDKDRVDIILTNPPFGGEEEKGILNNFPEDRRTAETAMLFFQLIMRKLRRAETDSSGKKKFGRAAVIVPDGTLFEIGIEAKIKEDLLKDFNLHTIVRLPKGVFAPYTDIQTNLLFFDRSGPTDVIWYYDQPLADGRKTYTKTKPMQYEEFAPCLEWWHNRSETPQAWRYNFRDAYQKAIADATPHWDAAKDALMKVAAGQKRAKEISEKLQALQSSSVKKMQDLDEQEALAKHLAALKVELPQVQSEEQQLRNLAKDEQEKGDEIYRAIYNLDIKNPNAKDDFEHLPPEQLAEDILKKEQRIMEIMAEIKAELSLGVKA